MPKTEQQLVAPDQDHDVNHDTDTNSDSQDDNNDQAQPIIQMSVNSHPMITRLKVGIQRPSTRYVLLASKFVSHEPKNITEAMKHPGWCPSVGEEMERIPYAPHMDSSSSNRGHEHS